MGSGGTPTLWPPGNEAGERTETVLNRCTFLDTDRLIHQRPDRHSSSGVELNHPTDGNAEPKPNAVIDGGTLKRE